VLTCRVSVFLSFCLRKVLQNPPVLPRSGHDRGPTQPARSINRPAPPQSNGVNPGQSENPRPTRPAPYLPPYLSGAKRPVNRPNNRPQTNPGQTNDRPKPARSNNRADMGPTNPPPINPARSIKRPANRPNDQPPPNPRKMQTTPQTGQILK